MKQIRKKLAACIAAAALLSSQMITAHAELPWLEIEQGRHYSTLAELYSEDGAALHVPQLNTQKPNPTLLITYEGSADRSFTITGRTVTPVQVVRAVVKTVVKVVSWIIGLFG